MIDWSKVFEKASPEPPASEKEIATFLAELGRPLSRAEIAAVNRFHNTYLADVTAQLADAANWQMPNRPVPESYISFLRYSNGGHFWNGERLFQMYGTGLRSMMLDRLIPQHMPLALPFAFNGGGVMYMFDMREPAVDGEYPIICAHAGCLNFDPHYSPKVADSFLEVCRGRFNVERLMHGGIVLNETTWETCTDLKPMLDDCRDDRKLRLFAVACCRRVAHLMPDSTFRGAIEMAERFAEGKVTDKKRQACKEVCKKLRETPTFTVAANAATEALHANAAQAAWNGAWSAAVAEADGEREGPRWDAARTFQVALLHEIFGNPHRTPKVDPAWLDFNGGVVRSLVQTIEEKQQFELMPILADALEEAGCTDDGILGHCRGPNNHVRGCWVIDLLLDAARRTSQRWDPSTKPRSRKQPKR